MFLKRKKVWIKWLASGFLSLVILAVAAIVLVSKSQDDRAKNAIFSHIDELPPREWGIVFGAKVWGDQPSPMLEDRLLTALEAVKAQKVRRLLLTGGPSETGPHEADLMYEWLIAHGVPATSMVRDDQGLRTLMSLQNARHTFGILSPVLFTQGFHLPRALYIAHALDLNAVGMASDRRVYKDATYNQLRELPARLKAVYETSPRMSLFIGILRDFVYSKGDKESAIAAGRQRIKQKFENHGMTYPPSKIHLVYFKTKRQLEVYVFPQSGIHHENPQFLFSYPVLAASGTFGPKLREGDLQVPEGLYQINYLNRRSRFHLSLRLNYPNPFDLKKAEQDGRTDLGNDIMIHGNAVSIGCLAIGNKAIEEPFALAVDTSFKQWKVILAPFDPRIEKEPEISGSAVPSWYQELLADLEYEIEKLPLESEN